MVQAFPPLPATVYFNPSDNFAKFAVWQIPTTGYWSVKVFKGMEHQSPSKWQHAFKTEQEAIDWGNGK